MPACVLSVLTDELDDRGEEDIRTAAVRNMDHVCVHARACVCECMCT